MSRTMRCCVVVVVAVVSLACSRSAMPSASLQYLDLVPLQIELGVDGLSGLTEDGLGDLWVISESRELLRVERISSRVQRIPIDGLAPHVETEAIAWVSENRFMIGTETDTDDRVDDPMVLVEVSDGRAKAVEQSACDYGMWGMLASSNRGVEGLCRVGNKIVVGTELVKTMDGKRVAPVGIFDLRTGVWTAFTVRLTSATGKLSGIACKKSGDGIDVRAIERHFGVSRLISFHLVTEEASRVVRSSVVADFRQSKYSGYNLEGLVWRENGSLVAVSDNRFKGVVQNESRLFEIRP